MKVRIFTDGACSGNPGPGGWGALFAFPHNTEKVSGGKRYTTNNEMELTAVVEALKIYIDNHVLMEMDEIEINSDSAYVVNAINQGWIKQWQKTNWITTTKGKPVRNCELWKKLVDLFSDLEWLNVKVTFIKVKGHSGNEFNELVDELAREEILKIKGEE